MVYQQQGHVVYIAHSINTKSWNEVVNGHSDVEMDNVKLMKDKNSNNDNDDNDSEEEETRRTRSWLFRMTRPDLTNFSFNHTATSLPLLIPFKKYTPYNAQATTHLYNSFWGLYLMEHDYLADFEAEHNLYGKTTALLKFLDSWTSAAKTLPEKISDL